MVLRLPVKSMEDYERHLVRFISTEVASQHRKIAFIDCKNCISPYLFARKELDSILDSLFVVRIDRPYDLLDYVRKAANEPLVGLSHYLLVSPYHHLLEGFPASEEKNWLRLWEQNLERLESIKPVHVVLMEEK